MNDMKIPGFGGKAVVEHVPGKGDVYWKLGIVELNIILQGYCARFLIGGGCGDA
jgi:hypothetical protein